MKIVFFGTGNFALAPLKKLIKSKHHVEAVVTQPDAPKGRGWQVMATPVKAMLEQLSPATEVLQPETLDEGFITHLKNRKADVFVVIDYGRILKKDVLNIPLKMCVNLHPSLLPKYRGSAPVNWAIANGEKETGNTVFKLTEKMDAGDIILQERADIGDKETAPELFERLSKSGAELLVKALDSIESGDLKTVKQNDSKATLAPKLKKEDGKIDWTKSPDEIINKVRAMQLWPGAFTSLEGKMLKIFSAEKAEGPKAKPGVIADTENFTVGTKDGLVKINVLQLEGKKMMPVNEFLRGFELVEGTVLGA